MKGGDSGDFRRISDYSLALRQIFLHRAIGTFEGAIVCFHEKLTYSMILSVRGNFETTAAVGFLHARLNSSAKGDISKVTVDDDLVVMLLGGRNQIIPEAPEAKQILTKLEAADKAVKAMPYGKQLPPNLLIERYNFLCEFCHPNFHSNVVAHDLDNQKGQFRMRHNDEMRKEEAEIVEDLLLCTPLFHDLYDDIPNVLVTIKTTPRAT